MAAKIIRRAAALFIITVFLAVSSLPAQSLILDEGDGFGDIKIGKSTMKDVISIYGDGYELIDHKKYSYEMVYKDLGLSFYSCQNDPNKEIFVVVFKSPAQVTTSKGIVLGQSTLGDVLRLYSKRGKRTYSDSDQKGVYFYVLEQKDPDEAYKPETFKKGTAEYELHIAKIIKRIELVEKGGLRQCGRFGGEDTLELLKNE